MLKNDVEIKHLQTIAIEYKSKYNHSMTQFEEDKNIIIENEEIKQNIKNKELILNLIKMNI